MHHPTADDGFDTRAPMALFLQRVAEQPDRPAIMSGEQVLSYAELAGRASAISALLHHSGIGPGDLVAINLPRSADQIAACLAAWRLGAAYLPLDTRWPEARRLTLAQRAGCRTVVSEQALGTLTLVEPTGAVETAGPDTAPSDPLTLAYVIFTSGSTGEPKAVEVGHDNLAALIAWHREAFALRPGTRTSHIAGLGFDAAAWEVWPTLAAGGTLVLADDATRLDPAALRDWLVEKSVEIAFAPTALAEPMVAMDWPADTSLRVLLTGADRLKVRPRHGLPFRFVNNYGPTESTVVATSGTVSPDGMDLPSIGRAIAGTTVHLLDSAGEPVLPGAVGEIFIGGVQLARGYRDDVALTDARFVAHPRFGRLYRTGDLGAMLPSGDIAFHGRVDAQVKVRGHRIEPAEITAAIQRVEGVSAAAVALRDGALVGWVVMAPGAVIPADTLRRKLSETLPDYMVPARFAALDTLPLTANGKLDVTALPDPASHAMAESAGGRPPEGPAETRIFEIVSSIIGRDDFGAEDDFFLLGGHSLLGTQVIMRARDAFGVELTLFHLFEGRTVAALAAKVEELVMEKLAGMSDEDIQRMSAA